MSKLTKQQRRDKRRRKRRERDERKAAIPRQRPWVAPKMKFFKMPSLLPDDVPREKRLEIVRVIGAQAKEKFDLKYPQIIAWFRDYDALYLLSFIAFYFASEREGVDVEALEEAIGRCGLPEIVNTDQGSQFTGSEFIEVLKARNIAISMDGRGCWRDNVFIERFWKTLKYEEVYLRAYDTVSEARASIARYIAFYNGRRPHTALADRTPDAAYFASSELKAAA